MTALLEQDGHVIGNSRYTQISIDSICLKERKVNA